MDKDILNYLDKVGQHLQGASEKGFEVYVNGVFVKSLLMTLIGLIIISVIAIASYKVIKKVIKKYFETEEYERINIDDLIMLSIIPFF